MIVERNLLGDAALLAYQPFEDQRGTFTRIFSIDRMKELEFTVSINQINLSFTRDLGVIRGMHYQREPYAEVKIIKCVSGKIFDVVVDMRPSSSTFLKWAGVQLDAGEPKGIYIPKGFAHGFQTLSTDVELIYLHSAPYEPKLEEGIRYDDPAISIEWPLEPINVSAKDSGYELLEARSIKSLK